MNSKEVRRNSIVTIVTRGINIILNFLVIVCTTQYWGAEGRGFIALFSADLAFVAIGLNILTASSVSFHSRKCEVSQLHLQALIWTVIIALIGALIIYLTSDVKLAFFIFCSAIVLGIYTFYTAIFIGEQKIMAYNILTALQPSILLICLLILRYTIDADYYAYFYSFIISFFISGLIALFLLKRFKKILSFSFALTTVKKCFIYGVKEEFGHLLQFFIARLGYYVLEFYSGTVAVGKFSVGVAISESIWIFSRSIANVQYSKTLEEGSNKKTLQENLKAVIYSVLITFVCIIIVLFMPQTFFTYVFGDEFADVKQIVLILSPGILIISFANVLVHYFSGIGNLNISILKSAIGFVFTIILSFLLIPKYSLLGASITSSLVYTITSIVVIIAFFRQKKRYH
jgi:O-antigen/teichoic acid export membrane protein